ncbi:UNVERIFIED_CONTAM: hypothetical protein FKN15_009324 [Acipenser sinensis]
MEPRGGSSPHCGRRPDPDWPSRSSNPAFALHAASSLELVEKDLPVAVTLLNNLTEQGLSFLELRYQLLLLYLQDLTHLLLKKVEGRSLRGDSGIERLLELRTVTSAPTSCV